MVISLSSALLWVLQLISHTVLRVVTFITMTVPASLFPIFSMSMTFTLNFPTLLLILFSVGSLLTWFVRYRFLNEYSALPQEAERKEPQIDLFPEATSDDSKPGLANYLDEFLAAIKVFGYLERPVFHELTRMMQTRKLIAGETLLLEEEKGFCLVVDGSVQIFVKSLRDRAASFAPDTYSDDTVMFDDEEVFQQERPAYQLLTEVKNGASMSSMFSILSMFTEDVTLRNPNDTAPSTPVSDPKQPKFTLNTEPRSRRPTFMSDADTVADSPIAPSDSQSDFTSPPEIDITAADSASHRFSRPTSPHPRQRPAREAPPSDSVHPDILARAVVDTTIAIIPEAAFRRLTRLYPKATAHIIQVILARLHRVTFATAHSYLGLVTEVTDIERRIQRYTQCDLPNHLRGKPLDRLKDKFRMEGDNVPPEEMSNGIALHNPSSLANSRSLRPPPVNNILSNARTPTRLMPRGNLAAQAYAAVEPEAQIPSPGDLLSTTQFSRYGSSPGPVFVPPSRPSSSAGPMNRPTNHPQDSFESGTTFTRTRSGAIDESIIFREALVECVMKALGLSTSQTFLRQPRTNSYDVLPSLVNSAYDARRPKSAFNNPFGLMGSYAPCPEETEYEDSLVSFSGGSFGGGPAAEERVQENLRDELEIVFYPKGSVLVEQGEQIPGIYYVIDGFLEVGVNVNEKGEAIKLNRNRQSNMNNMSSDNFGNNSNTPAGRHIIYLVNPGTIEGYVGSITPCHSLTDVVARTDVFVGFIPRSCLERIADKYPSLSITMAKRLTSVLPRLLLHIDFALEWVQISAGEVLHHQGDESDAIYIVLNGRLRSVRDKGKGKLVLAGEYGQGDSVGELEVMTESTRPTTIHAIRDTEIARFPRSLFNGLSQEHPGITIQISKLVAMRMRSLVETSTFDDPQTRSPDHTSMLNLRTVAVVPVAAGVPVVEFGNRLLNAFTQIGVPNGAIALHQADILNHLGRHAFSRMGKLKLSQYLADLEEKYGMLLYIADTSVNSPWTQTCMTQADCILMVAIGEQPTSIGEYERLLLGTKTTARKSLILLHNERYSPSGLTREWLKNRVWINGGHHHIQMPYSLAPEAPHPVAKRFNKLKQRVQVIQANIQKYASRRIPQAPLYSPSAPYKGDFHRLARRLCGKAVGVVCGGGGARGIAHIGVIRAIEEAGIPIDIVGGTSMGSFIGALYARDADVVPLYGRAKKFAAQIGSVWRFLLDMTYPSASYTTGLEFNRGIFKAFGDMQIEDFWLEYFCNTTNISKSRCEFHHSGYVWRYVRASMSLAGLVPPLCDQGMMLLDGGYVDNLPVVHMKALGADVIIAIDVGSVDDDTPQTYGDSLSGFWALLNRWNPFSPHPNTPALSDIQARLAYVSSVDALERAKYMPGCYYIRPPIDAYGILEFGKFDEIYEVGYKAGASFAARLKSDGVFPAPEDTEEKKQLRRTMAPRRASI